MGEMFVLIAVVSSYNYGSGPVSLAVEFSSLDRCNAAIIKLEEEIDANHSMAMAMPIAFCVEK